MRGALVPRLDHIGTLTCIAVLAAIDVLLLVVGLRKFNGKAIG
jgi:hypothetical protein